MNLLHVVILAIVQGLAELLPVSSSAHVVVSEKLMGMDPTSPEMTLLLVMLHTGTMFAVIVYFWRQWARTYFQSAETFKQIAILLVAATVLTGIVGEGLIKSIEKFGFHGAKNAEVEQLFGRLDLIAPALGRRRYLDFDCRPLRETASICGNDQHGRPRDGARRRDRNRAGTLPALPRLFALRRDDIHGPAGGRGEIARRSIQLRSRRSDHSRSRWTRSPPPHEGRAHQWRIEFGSAMTPSLIGMVCAFVAGLTGAEVAQQVAGERPLVFFWDLLSGRRSGRRCPKPHRLLIRQ